MSEFACGPCRNGHHHQCRDREWGGCPCPHPRGLTSASTPPNQPALVGRADVGGVEGAAGLGAGEVAGPTAPDGCRFAGRPHHVCRTSFGQVLQPGQVCFSDARATLADEYPGMVG